MDTNDQNNVTSAQDDNSVKSILDLLKDSAEPVIAILTAVIAVVFFLWRIMVYMYDVAYLYYWKIDIAHAPYFTPQGALVAMILFILALGVVKEVIRPFNCEKNAIDTGLGTAMVVTIFLFGLYFMYVLEIIPASENRNAVTGIFWGLSLGAVVLILAIFAAVKKRKQPIQQLTNLKWLREVLRSIKGYVIILILVAFTMAICGCNVASEKETFPVVEVETENGTEYYAIIYQTEDRAIMLSCAVDEEERTFSIPKEEGRNVQKIVSSDDLEYEVMTLVDEITDATQCTEPETQEPSSVEETVAENAADSLNINNHINITINGTSYEGDEKVDYIVGEVK